MDTQEKSRKNLPSIVSEKGLLLKERICFHWEQILSFKSSPNEEGRKYFVRRSFFIVNIFSLGTCIVCIMSTMSMLSISAQTQANVIEAFNSSSTYLND